MASSSTEVPPPRRKSCAECVKAKRRCDLRTPTCLRCVKKNLSCTYPCQPEQGRVSNTQIGFATDHGTISTPTLLEDTPVAFPDYIEADPANTFDLSLGLNTYSSLLIEPSTKEIDLLDRVYWEPSVGWAQDSADMEPYALQINAESKAVYKREDYHKMNPICDDFTHEHLTDSSTQLGYTITTVKNYHRDLALHNKTSFLHPRLYRDKVPTTIVNVFTTSVLYANKTRANEAIVFCIMDKNVSDLLESPAQLPQTLGDGLPRVQALVLYQTMRLFDGDIRQRANAEAAMPMLQAWTDHLTRLRDNLNDVENRSEREVTLRAPQSWEMWILAESVRRTIIIAYCVIQLYGLIKSGDTSTGPWATVHPWTLSRHLWEARSSFDFFRMWREKPHYTISNVFFDNFLKDGKGDQVDNFARLLLVVYMGMDETRQWFHDTGSCF